MSLIRPSVLDWRPFVTICAKALGRELSDEEVEESANAVGAQMDEAAGRIERCLSEAEPK